MSRTDLSMLEALFNVPVSEPKIILEDGGSGEAISCDLSGSGRCRNCGLDDWTLDVQGGDYVCSCGCCETALFVHQDVFHGEGDSGRNHRFLDTGDPRLLPLDEMEARALVGKKNATYKHQFYFNERLRQWAMQEPEIPKEDWDEIAGEFRWWARRQHLAAKIPTSDELRSSKGRIPGTILLTKTEIYTILLACDNQPADPYAFEAPRKRGFVKRYFEKWLTIRYRLSGEKSSFYRCPAWVIETIQDLFPVVLAYFLRCVYKRGERTTFFPYNFVFARLLDLVGYSDCCNDFPPQKQRKKRQATAEMWQKFCEFQQWPYINSDPR